eukprot:TRINITY_DN6972_c0_g2_i1.p1 TRINITY_DN6972_c0_g2~~TRINITY_DN6972_c0_g2_i1.p1  ORF type:complete len:158 (+),score=29.46 TRINITY_DN6972_c0_g2_i1:207-680(+)
MKVLFLLLAIIISVHCNESLTVEKCLKLIKGHYAGVISDWGTQMDVSGTTTTPVIKAKFSTPKISSFPPATAAATTNYINVGIIPAWGRCYVTFEDPNQANYIYSGYYNPNDDTMSGTLVANGPTYYWSVNKDVAKVHHKKKKSKKSKKHTKNSYEF